MREEDKKSRVFFEEKPIWHFIRKKGRELLLQPFLGLAS